MQSQAVAMEKKCSWDDAFLQSLPCELWGFQHIERRDSLVKDIKKKLRDSFDSMDHNMDLLNRLNLVDSLVSLGIERHFELEIREALQFAFRSWSENQGGIGTGTAANKPDLNTTALAFMYFRLYRFPKISSEVLATLVSAEEGDQETGFFEEKLGSNRVITLLNLLRSSQIQFPGEFVLQKLEQCCTHHLNQWLVSSESSCGSNAVSDYLINQVKYFMTYEWTTNADRWNVRCSIDFYGSDEQWLRCQDNKMILHLAKLDYNIIQSMLQQELKELSRWWHGSDVSKLSFIRAGAVVKSFFWPASSVYQEELQRVRSVVFKAMAMITVLNDIYDEYATHQEMNQVTQTVKRRDLSTLNSVRNPIKIAMESVFTTFSELAQECTKMQRSNMEPYLIPGLEETAERYQEKRDWIEAKCLPSFHEYMLSAIPSTALHLISIATKLAACEGYPVNLLHRELTTPCLLDVCSCKSGRLIDDVQEALANQTKGEVNGVHCYMKDHPECNLEKAAQKLMEDNREVLRQATQLYLDPGADNDDEKGVPLVCKAVRFESLRAMNLMYLFGDGLGSNNPNFLQIIQLVLFEAFPV